MKKLTLTVEPLEAPPCIPPCLEKYAERQGYRIAALVDEAVAVVVKPRPKWMPLSLYNRVIKNVVEIVHLPSRSL